MQYLTRVPQPPLSQFVNLLWLYDGYSQPHAKERVLPTGEMELVINLREDRLSEFDRQDTGRRQSFPGSLLCGTHSQYFVIDTSQQMSIMGVHFRPGGAFPFFRLPASELEDTMVALDVLWGRQAVDMRDQLLEAASHEDRLTLLEQWLWKQLLRPLERHGAVGFALRQFQSAPHVGTISDVTRQIGLSAKRFIDVFRAEVGVTPKVFCRIQRFQRALHRLEERQRVEWANVALDCGYFDQSHFNHDFRAFSGLNPSTYLAHRTPHLNHVPLLD